MSTAEEYFQGLKGKKIAFIGLGVTNNDCIRLFLRKGLNVTVCDRKTQDQLGELYQEFAAAGASFSLGEDYLKAIWECDVVYRAPGVYYHLPVLQEAQKRGIVITSEMETFFKLCPCKIYAVTGSDGKTTTTTLIAEMLAAAGKRVHKGGNIGRALLPIVEEIQPGDVAVVELSSFQLLSMRRSPDVAVVTNISPNHLDVHGTMEEYVDSKKNILLHQDAYSKTILNADNPMTEGLSPLVRGNLLWFSRQKEGLRGAYLQGDTLYFSDGKNTVPILNRDEIRLPGIHNVENYLAAAAAVWGEAPAEKIRKVAREFGGVEHRIEFVRELDGVKWYNDSIATSPTRTMAGLNSFSQRLIMIAGGYDKKIPFEPMAETVCERVKILLLTGDTAGKIQQAITACPKYSPESLSILRVDSLEEAVKKARELSQPGDIVSLSPACASFDRYPNFEARGNRFKELVRLL